MNDLFARERQDWVEDCQAAARKLLVTKEEITIEDVLRICPRPRYIHRNTTGSVFKHSDFRMCGFTKSQRAVSKGRWIMKWKLNEDSFPLTMRQIQRSRQKDMAGQ